MTKFEVGELAIWVGGHRKGWPCLKGQLVKITSPLGPMADKKLGYGFSHPDLDPPPNKAGWAGAPRCFKKLPPKQDLGSWDDCVFKPKELAHVKS